MDFEPRIGPPKREPVGDGEKITAAVTEAVLKMQSVEMVELRALAIACRSSVKFDLLHYEKMARAYGNIGREGEQTAAAAEAEAQRLHALLEKIDALALTTPNY